MFDGLGMTKPRIWDVITVVCKHEKLTVAEIKSHSRAKRLAIPRQYLMYLARSMTGASYPQIARMLGDRDHTTILHGYRKIRALAKCSPPLAEKLDYYRAQILEAVAARAAISGQSTPWNPPASLAVLKPSVVTVTMAVTP